MDHKPDNVQKQEAAALALGSDWRIIDVVFIPAQQQPLYVWKRLEICSLGIVRSVVLGYGYSPTKPEYHMSCYREPQRGTTEAAERAREQTEWWFTTVVLIITVLGLSFAGYLILQDRNTR